MNSWAGWDLLQTAMWKNQKHLGNLRGFLFFFFLLKTYSRVLFLISASTHFLERKFMHSEAVTLSNFWHRGNALFLSSILLGSMFDYITNPSTHFSLIDLKHKPSSLQAFPTDHQVSIWDLCLISTLSKDMDILPFFPKTILDENSCKLK